MITTKKYDKAIGEAAAKLREQFTAATVLGADYKDVAEAVAKITLELYNLTMKFMGQEEVDTRDVPGLSIVEVDLGRKEREVIEALGEQGERSHSEGEGRKDEAPEGRRKGS